MKERVLFTCVGSTDPVRNLRDGAMLHIIRHYLPQKVYIVLSSEMEKLHHQDDRYNKAIQKFCSDFDQNVEARFLSSKIKDVSDFDIFDSYFQKQLTEIIKENPQAEILLNISSGSPQMKITMCLLATNAKFKNIKVVQVKSPEKGANTSDTTAKKNYDVDANIELNEDNTPDAENRCSEPPIFSMKRAFALKQVQTLLNNYEYTSAKLLLSSLGLTEDNSHAVILTDHLIERQNLKLTKAMKTIRGINIRFKLMPVSNSKCVEETEFFLVLQNLQRTGKITEFTLRLNPFIISMQELYLRRRFKFECNDIKTSIKIKNDKYIEQLDHVKIAMKNSGLYTFFDSQYKYGYKDTFPSIAAYNHILTFFNQQTGDAETAYYIDFFKTCQGINDERNSSAHSLYGMDEDDFIPFGITSQTILNNCKKLLISCYGKECCTEIFDIYERTNQLIMENL